MTRGSQSLCRHERDHEQPRSRAKGRGCPRVVYSRVSSAVVVRRDFYRRHTHDALLQSARAGCHRWSDKYTPDACARFSSPKTRDKTGSQPRRVAGGGGLRSQFLRLGRPNVGNCANTDRWRDAIAARTRSAACRYGPNAAEPDAGAPVGNGQPAAYPHAERAMKIVIFFFGITVAFIRPACALTPGDLSRITLEQHPGLQLSHDLVFRDENGQQFRFGNSAIKQPTVLVPGYYRCPMLCPLINDGLIQALQELRMSVGRDFQVVDFSIDPGDTAADAARKKSEYLRRYGRAGAAQGWHCIVGDQHAIAHLADEIGFRYAYDPETKQYAHPSGVIVLTLEGKISRYIFGATFDARELRDALVAAREGESTSTLSKLFLVCYHYNPITGKYGALIMSIVRFAGIATLLAIIGSVALMVGRDRRARRALYEASPSPDGPAVRPYQ